MLNLRNLNWPAWTLAFLFLAVAAGAPCFQPQQTDGHHAYVGGNNSNGAANHSEANASPLVSPPKSPKVETRESSRNDGSCLPCLGWQAFKGLFFWWIHDPNAFFGSWVAIFTGLLVYRTIMQERANKISQRAYVKMSHTEPGVRWEGQTGRFKIALKITNHGITPARVTDVVTNFFLPPLGMRDK
jgi:hypothetical protein